MGTDAAVNPWWRDVLENGRASAYAEFFDIDWDPEKTELKGKVLLPILGDQYGVVLERGELRLSFKDGRFSLRYADLLLPIDPQQAPRLLGVGLEELKRDLEGRPEQAEFLSVLTQLGNLPTRSETAPERVAERRRESEIARLRLAQLVTGAPRVARHVGEALAALNGRPGEAESFDALHGLLECQAYRLSYWKTAADEINYRRFFDINGLAGLRMEVDEAFDATHRLVLELLATEKITGLRIDHPDGLYDPARYFERLQASFFRAWLRRRLPDDRDLSAEENAEAEAWRGEELRKDFRSAAARPLYVVCEKILSPEETLDPHWDVDGTSGYDFLNDLSRVFIDPRGAAALRGAYERFTDQRTSFEAVVYESKKLIMATSMASELNVLAGLLNRISERDRRTRDFTWQSLRNALVETIACFPVYRTYVTERRATAFDRHVIDPAVPRARPRNPALEPPPVLFIRPLLPPPSAEPLSDGAGGEAALRHEAPAVWRRSRPRAWRTRPSTGGTRWSPSTRWLPPRADGRDREAVS